MRPLFSATKIRPSGAKRTAVGFVSPLSATVSWKPAGGAAAAARSVAVAPLSAAPPNAPSSAAGAVAGAISVHSSTRSGAMRARRRRTDGRGMSATL